MAHFDRFDVCAAWNLYLQHTWDMTMCPKYARWCKLRRFYKPAPREEHVLGLSDNARAIYSALMGAA